MNLNHRVRFAIIRKNINPNFTRCIQLWVEVTVAVKSIVTFDVHFDQVIYTLDQFTLLKIFNTTSFDE